MTEELQGWTTRIPLPLNIKNLEAKFVSLFTFTSLNLETCISYQILRHSIYTILTLSSYPHKFNQYINHIRP